MLNKVCLTLRGVSLAVAIAGGFATLPVQAEATRAEVIHWWTSAGESAAIGVIAEAFNQSGGQWVDNAVAGGSNARNATINRILGGNPPAAAQFNTSTQYHEIIAEGLLNDIDQVAQENNWDRILPQPILNAIKVDGHFYAAPVNIHMPSWIWYSKAAFARAGISQEPQNFEQLFAAFDKLQAAGLVPLALGGQAWQEWITFNAVLGNVGGAGLYQRVYTDSSGSAVRSDEFRQVLRTFKRMKQYVDAGSPGRNWNDATAMLIKGQAGVQIMGDWAKGEFSVAGMKSGQDFGCIAGFGNSPYLLAGDVFVFPRSDDGEVKQAQRLLASTMLEPDTQVFFNIQKGSIPVRADVNAGLMDECAQKGLAIMQDKSRHMANPDQLLAPDVDGALKDVITEFWNSDMAVDEAVNRFARALQG